MTKNIILIARQFWQETFRVKSTYFLLVITVILLILSAYSGLENYQKQSQIRDHHQQEARHSWESNPDKHPHRMAHFGTFAFRKNHPLSLFDFGISNYTGNAVFLEAHQQNSVNFSEASFSTGTLRFGELSMAMILQIIIPLMIFFLGFACISSAYEKGTLKISIVQGASWKELILGKSLGLFSVALVFYIPFLLTTSLIIVFGNVAFNLDLLLRVVGLFLGYTVYFIMISILTVLISAFSKTSKGSLVRLLAIWLIFIIFLPKAIMSLGYQYYPSPTKVAFETMIEEELIRKGDSHNPDDPYFQDLRDSVLQVHQVKSVEELPFNYSGFVMREGERNSSETYQDHKNKLMRTFRMQYAFARFLSLINPYLAIKNISMALSGTDFETYVDFQHQAEQYRYQLAQTMNELQMEHISNQQQISTSGTSIISNEYWKNFPDFMHQLPSSKSVWKIEWISIISLCIWTILSVFFINYLSTKSKAV